VEERGKLECLGINACHEYGTVTVVVSHYFKASNFVGRGELWEKLLFIYFVNNMNALCQMRNALV
jgi:hypothetical protein